jgi:hypothetical protein
VSETGRQPRRASKSIGPSALPWEPPALSKADAYAVKALAAGNANEGQQKTAWDFIMRLTGVRDLEFRPDERASTFASGKRFVGLQLVKPLTLPASVIDKLDP